MWWISATNPSQSCATRPGAPRGLFAVAVKPAVNDIFRVTVDGAEDAGKNLEGQLVDIHCQPETSRATTRQGKLAKILGRNDNGLAQIMAPVRRGHRF